MARPWVSLLSVVSAGTALLLPANGPAPAATPHPPPADRTGAVRPPVPLAAPEGSGAPATIGGAALRDELRQALEERRALEEERKALAAERAALEARAAELDRTREELRAETARLEALLARRPPAAGDASTPRPPTTPAGLLALARAAKGMKPAEVAAVLERLDPTTAADVLLRMRPADAGAALAGLPPEKAALLAAEMTRRPVPRGTP